MHRCSSSQGNMVGPCTCGMFHSQGNCFSMLFSMPNHKPFDDEADMYAFTSSSSSASVDCTLSLGTPSTRLTNADPSDQKRSHHYDQRSSSCMPNFYWDILQPKPTTPHPPSKSGRGSAANNSGGGGDPLLARRCANCDTTSTPLWRNGPRGPKSLCNACGIRFKKEERRASAAAAAATTSNGGAASGMMEAQHMMSQHSNSWGTQYHQQNQTQKMGCFSPAMGNEFRFIDDDDDRDADSGIPFLSWRLNVTDRPASLVHDFTR